MSDIICVTDRKLCKGDFLVQLERVAAAGPAGIILREKDLPEREYAALAREVLDICGRHGVPCILHSFPEAAKLTGCFTLHLPLHLLLELSEGERSSFHVLGASCHSVEDAVLAEQLGCTYITAGHVFTTSCKPGLEPRGLDFLRSVCAAVSIPVYAIGGISPENIAAVRAAGAAGGCVMSGFMECPDPAALLERFRSAK